MTTLRSGHVSYPEYAGTCANCACCFDCHRHETATVHEERVAPCPTCGVAARVFARRDEARTVGQ